MPGRQAVPLGQIDLPVTFGDRSNYRTEILTFDVVGFPGTFQAILGRPCYAKFMAVPNYTYLKLKMSGPRGVITIGTSFQRAYECEVECCGHASAVIASEELATLREKVVEEAPDAKKSTGSFKSAEGSREVLLDPSSFEGKKSPYRDRALLQVGKRARRLPPRQQGHLCMETLEYVGHPEEGRRAYSPNPPGLQAGETTPTPLRRGETQGHQRGDSQTIGRRIH